MRKGRGFTTVPHQRATRFPRRAIDIRSQNCLADGSCTQCQARIAQDPDKGLSDVQTIGLKGLELVCSERGIVNASKKTVPELVELLEQFADFRDEKSAIEHLLITVGHLAMLGAVSHPELAFVEMIWAFLKEYLRKRVDDKEATLLRLMKEGMSQIPIEKFRAAARHCRDAMEAYRRLRASDTAVTPTEVANLAGVQKAHRMPYAAMMAGLVAAAGVAPSGSSEEIEKRTQAAATLKVRQENSAGRSRWWEVAEAKRKQLDNRANYKKRKASQEPKTKPMSGGAADAHVGHGQPGAPEVITIDD